MASRADRALPAMTALAMLAACVGPTDNDLVTDGSPQEARLALELAAATGPVRGRVLGLDAGPTAAQDEARVLALMGHAVTALPVRFRANNDAAPPSPELVVTLGALNGADPCDPPPASSDTMRVTAAFCEGGRAIGAASGQLDASDDATRTTLYRRLARSLFPDVFTDPAAPPVADLVY